VPRVDFSFYLVTDRHQTGGRPLVPLIERALGAGLRAVQLREKDLDTKSALGLAEALLGLTRRHQALLLINDRVDLVLALGADGVHLRADSLPIFEARRLLGPTRYIGASTHSADEVEQAAAAGADFVVLGPIYDTPSKRAYGPPIGIRPIQEARRRCAVPVLAIGGVTPDCVPELMAAGACGLAVTSAVLAAERVEVVTHRFLTALKPYDDARSRVREQRRS
jgi:thiamine-phosphate pyrophosphorylase